jgi:hypothetical protein
LLSAALVAVTLHVPAEVLLKVEPLTVQAVAVPLVAAKLTAPVPEPPLVVKPNGVPNTPDVEVNVSADWAALANVTVVGAEDTAR